MPFASGASRQAGIRRVQALLREDRAAHIAAQPLQVCRGITHVMPRTDPIANLSSARSGAA